MHLLRLALSNPVAVTVAVLLAFLFGAISLTRLPVQLTPEVERPEISVTTNWRSAAPQEVESEIIEPQEDALRGVPGATEMLAQARNGSGVITLTFEPSVNLDRALLEVINRLNRVPSYPLDADEPVISTGGGNGRAIAWFIVKPINGNTKDIASYHDYLEEVVQSRFERVPGVALSQVRGGREREVRITFDPYRAAALDVQLPRVLELVGARDVSGGTTDVGRRSYTLRFDGAYQLDDLNDLIIDWRDGSPILLRDIADVKLQLVDRTGFVIQNGQPAIAINAYREAGVNVINVMDGLKQAAKDLSEGPLKRANLAIEQVYDETVYIDRSLALVGSNLALGVLLAIGVLWWFLRHFRATLIVALAIPTSIFATFIILDLTGRSINVISLAGIAFAVGMVLDAAIVVLENIVRLREQGMDPLKAAKRGTAQVWGALLASTATTVAIFLPIVFLENEAGQLFADLALTIAIAVIFSLIIALLVLPTAAMNWLKKGAMKDPHHHWWNAISNSVMWLTNGALRRALWIIFLLAIPLYVVYELKPEADYLPTGNRNLVLMFINPPPGQSIDVAEHEMGDAVVKALAPHIAGEVAPYMKDYFFVITANGAFLGGRTIDPKQTRDLLPILNNVVSTLPDTIGVALQASLFAGTGTDHSIDVNIQGRDLEAILAAARESFRLIPEIIPGSRIRPFPGLALDDPELRLLPRERRIAEAGWSRETMGAVVRALGDGLLVADYFDGEETLDIILRATPWNVPEELMSYPLATPGAGVLPLSELVEMQRTAGPNELRRLDRRRTVTLQVRPPEDVSLEAALNKLKNEYEPAIYQQLPLDASISYSGSANKLESALQTMLGAFSLAIIILYLLMSALFRSFKDSLLVLLVIPLATVGGVSALAIMNLYRHQSMDLLTMIGFVILLGLVINNAILLVYQTRAAEREGMSRRDAVNNAVHLRLRPILMTTLTSIFGMLPLLLVPGAGSELYRGLAGVIVGGMTVSTIFTLILLPSLLRIGEKRHLGSSSVTITDPASQAA
ncbi:MAG: efflux RND transporter permease subunit [Thiotrichales bacterium]|nr:efflux RND transporter permease subunit [Thiotrichales bacterium]